MAALKRWCWPCTAFGVALFLFSVVAMAQSPTPQEQGAFGFSNRDLIAALLGVVMLVIGAYTAGLRKQVDDNEKELKLLAKELVSFQLNMAHSHMTKSEVVQRFDKQDENINAIHRRLDRVGFPAARGNSPEDER